MKQLGSMKLKSLERQLGSYMELDLAKYFEIPTPFEMIESRETDRRFTSNKIQLWTHHWPLTDLITLSHRLDSELRLKFPNKKPIINMISKLLFFLKRRMKNGK